MQKQVDIYGSLPFPHLLSRLFSDCQSLLFMRHIALMSVFKEALRADWGFGTPSHMQCRWDILVIATLNFRIVRCAVFIAIKLLN